MNLKLAGILAGVAMMGGVALAQEEMDHPMDERTMQQQPMNQPAAQVNELQGKVLGVGGSTLYIQGRDGVAIPLEVSRDTLIDGKKIKGMIGSHLDKNFKEGDEVRVSFELKKGFRGHLVNQAVKVDKANK